MKKISYLIIFSMCISFQTFAQNSFQGLNSSPDAGVMGLNYNPASTIYGRNAHEVTFLGINNYFDNNMFSIKLPKGLKFDSTNNFQSFRNVFLKEKNVDEFNMHFRNDIQLPSASFKIGKNYFSLAIENHIRFSISNLNVNIAKQSLAELEDPSRYNIDYNSDNFSAQVAVWNDVSLGYGREVLNIGSHHLAAAGRLKFLLPVASAFIHAEKLDVKFKNADSIDVDVDINYGHANNIDLYRSEPGQVFKQMEHLGLGLDLGVMYAYQPNPEEPIKFRTGLAVTNIGALKYDNDPTIGNFTGKVTNWNIGDFDADSIAAFDDSLDYRFSWTERPASRKIALPTALNWQADYQLNKFFGVSAQAVVAFYQPQKRAFKLQDIGSFTMSARFDTRIFGAYLPLTFNTLTPMQAGLTLRVGPLLVGSSNVFNNLLSPRKKASSFYLAFRANFGKNKTAVAKVD